MLESLNLAEEEEEDSACWFEGAKERSADISCTMMSRLKRDTCGINFVRGGEWELCWRIKAKEETVNSY